MQLCSVIHKQREHFHTPHMSCLGNKTVGPIQELPKHSWMPIFLGKPLFKKKKLYGYSQSDYTSFYLLLAPKGPQTPHIPQSKSYNEQNHYCNKNRTRKATESKILNKKQIRSEIYVLKTMIDNSTTQL